MRKTKHIFAAALLSTLLLAGSINVMAAGYQSPADIVSALTGKTVEDVVSERFDSGKTFGTLAKEAGKLEEFKEATFDLKKDQLNEDVANGLLTREEADQLLNLIKERQATCDGTGNNQKGYGCGYGKGRGRGFRNGSCLYNN